MEFRFQDRKNSRQSNALPVVSISDLNGANPAHYPQLCHLFCVSHDRPLCQTSHSTSGNHYLLSKV